MTELTREEKYKITSESLTGLTELRKFAKTKNFEWLENLANQLNGIVEEQREEFELRKLELAELEEKRLKAIRYLEELGLDPETVHISVFETTDKKGKKGKSRNTNFWLIKSVMQKMILKKLKNFLKIILRRWVNLPLLPFLTLPFIGQCKLFICDSLINELTTSSLI
nr:hypothetical protein [Providencia alcalifaciens]